MPTNQPEQSKTPETDAEDFKDTGVVKASFTSQLEIQRDEARNNYIKLTDSIIGICSKGTDQTRFASVPEMMVAMLQKWYKSEQEELTAYKSVADKLAECCRLGILLDNPVQEETKEALAEYYKLTASVASQASRPQS